MLKFANLVSSDVVPFEVVRVVSDKTLVVRHMNVERDPSWKPEFDVGGFVAHCTNQSSQRWIINSDPNGFEVRIRKNKHGEWKSPCGSKFRLSETPVCFYDYNF